MKHRRIILLPLLFILLIIAVPAWADIIIDGDAAFTAAVERCLKQLSEAGGATAQIVSDLESSNNNHVIQETAALNNSTTYNNTNDANSVAAGGTGNGTGTTVNWNPNNRTPYPGDVARDPCASLLHELRHALDGDTGTRDPRADPATGIRQNEIRACTEENRYRNGQGLPQRRTYDGRPLPAGAIF